MPDGVRPLDLWFDLSPMRPDEWGRQDATTWHRAMAIQAAYRKGIASANDEHAMKDQGREQERALKAEVYGR